MTTQIKGFDESISNAVSQLGCVPAISQQILCGECRQRECHFWWNQRVDFVPCRPRINLIGREGRINPRIFGKVSRSSLSTQREDFDEISILVSYSSGKEELASLSINKVR